LSQKQRGVEKQENGVLFFGARVTSVPVLSLNVKSRGYG